jgi:hypothetical protein
LRLLVFHAYINEMHDSRSKIPSKNLVRQRCAKRFNSGVKGLNILPYTSKRPKRCLPLSCTIYIQPTKHVRRSVQLTKFLTSDIIENDCYIEKGNIFCYSTSSQRKCAQVTKKNQMGYSTGGIRLWFFFSKDRK